MKIDEYLNFLGFFISSKFHVSENCLRTEIDLVEDDIRLVLVE